jgi:hypothetical protein
MAYLDIADRIDAGHRRATFLAEASASHAPAAFTGLEWQVIRMAQTDPLTTLLDETKLARLIPALFGWDQKRPLANPGLEALRRVAVLSWHHGHNVDAREIEAFVAAGYSTGHYDTLLAHIDQAKQISSKGARA